MHEQIANHLRTGSLDKDAVISPIMSNDGQVRQYILTDLIHNPNANEKLAGLQPGSKITNTTVDRSK